MPEQKPTTATDDRWKSVIAAVKEFADFGRDLKKMAPEFPDWLSVKFGDWFVEDELPEQLSGPFFQVTDVEDEGGWRVDGNGDVIGICRVYLKLPLEYVVETLIKDMETDALAADDRHLQKIRKCWDEVLKDPPPPEAWARKASITRVFKHMAKRAEKQEVAWQTWMDKCKKFEDAVRDYANKYHYDFPTVVLDEEKVCLNDWYEFFSGMKDAAPTSGEQAKALRQIEKLKAALG